MSDLDLTLATAPIPGESPTGASAKYEPEYETLTAEIDKMESVTKGDVNWKSVVELSSGLLREKSKDLMAGSALAMGLLSTGGYPSFATGLSIVRELIRTWWDGLHPELKRLRARSAAIQWLNDRASAQLATRPQPGESDRDTLTQCVNAAVELRTVVGEKFTEDAPDLGALERTLREKLSQVPEPVVATPEAAPPADGSAPAAPPPPRERVIDSPESAEAAVRDAVEILLKVAEAYRAAQPADPRSFRLRRAAARDLALPVIDGKLLTGDGPAPDALAALEKRLEAGELKPVLAESEDLVVRHPWWLDADLMTARALEFQGPRYRNAAAALRAEAASVLRRFPALADAAFGNGVPAASGKVQAWLSDAPPSAGPLETAAAEARALVARNQFGDAVTKLQSGPGPRSGRDRFLWRLETARVCLEAGQADIALPQLEALDAESRERKLDDWDPLLTVDLLTTLLRCCSALTSEGDSAKRQSLFARLCTLDLTAAAAFRPPKA